MNRALAGRAALAAVAWLAAADQPPAGDARAIVERSLAHETFDMDAPSLPDYTYTIEDEEKKLNADGSVHSTNSETREAMNLYGGHFERVVGRNGKNLPPEKARAEQASFDKAVAKRKQEMDRWQARETPELHAQLEEAIRKAKARRQRCNESLLGQYDVAMAGAEEVNGRPAWIVDMKPHGNVTLAGECGGDLKIMARFRLKLWIDQEEYRWARIEADNVAPVVFGKILFRVPAGAAHFEYQQVRHEDGIWLVSRDRLRAFAKVMLAAPYRLEETETYSGYRKYQADSRIVPAGQQ